MKPTTPSYHGGSESPSIKANKIPRGSPPDGSSKNSNKTQAAAGRKSPHGRKTPTSSRTPSPCFEKERQAAARKKSAQTSIKSAQSAFRPPDAQAKKKKAPSKKPSPYSQQPRKAPLPRAPRAPLPGRRGRASSLEVVEEDPAKNEEGDSTDDDGELRSITAGLAPGRHQVVPTRTKPPPPPKQASSPSSRRGARSPASPAPGSKPKKRAPSPRQKSPTSEAPLRASLKRVLAAEEMAPFTAKQSLEEIEQLQNLLAQKKSQLLRSADASPAPEAEDEKKDDEEVARSALGRLTEMSRRLADASKGVDDADAAHQAALEAAEDEEVASIVSDPKHVYGGSISSSGQPSSDTAVDAFTESILQSKRDEIAHTSVPTGESDSDRPVAPNDKMFSSAYGAWVAKSRPTKKEQSGRQPPVHETFGLGVSTEDEYAPLSFRVLDDLEERTGIQERPRPPHIDVNPPRRSLDGWRRPPSFRSFASTSPETVISSVSDYTTWSCASPRSPNHVEFTYRPPPEFVPRIRLEALRSPRSSGDLQAFSPDPAKSVSSLYSPRSAFTPRSDASASRRK